jgi:lysyl-tRNA synthetase class II
MFTSNGSDITVSEKIPALYRHLPSASSFETNQIFAQFRLVSELCDLPFRDLMRDVSYNLNIDVTAGTIDTENEFLKLTYFPGAANMSKSVQGLFEYSSRKGANEEDYNRSIGILSISQTIVRRQVDLDAELLSILNNVTDKIGKSKPSKPRFASGKV